jgi:aminoglycoside phosphotransferase (APT) family kinase protein
VKERPVALPSDLLEWIEGVGEGRLTRADRVQGGARKEAWFVDIARPDGTTAELFLRYDRTDPGLTKDPWTLHREATFYTALQETAVPVPRVLGVHDVHQAMLAERVEGNNWFSRIADPHEQEETARDFMAKLAALHALNPASLCLRGFSSTTTIPDTVHLELDEWDSVITERGGEADPALTFTLHWLRRNVPAYEGPVVLVQGDTGPGNFMYRDGRVVAVVDWELAHFGDPMDDIAWLSLRTTQEPFPDFPQRLREYEELSGNVIDEERVHYYQVAAEAKLQVMSHRPAGSSGRDGPQDGSEGSDVGNGFIYGVLHRRLWLEALAGVIEIELTPAEIPLHPTRREHDWMYAAVLGQLREVVVPRITDPLAKARSKGLARLVKYLEQVDSYGEFYEACELADLKGLLGRDPGSVPAGRADISAEVRSGRIGDNEYVRYLWRRVARETELARPSMGALADRHWPPLRSEEARARLD